RAGGRRCRYRRDLLSALARHAGAVGRGQGRGVVADAQPLPRRLGPCPRPHAARVADRIEAGRFSALIVRSTPDGAVVTSARSASVEGHRRVYSLMQSQFELTGTIFNLRLRKI